MKNVMIGMLIGMLMGIAAVALDNLLLEWTTSYELPKSEYHFEQPEKKTQVLDVRLHSQGESNGNHV
ncbi:MAG: hypothetical protein V3U56_12165 [Syntrophobacteria bacterium]|jgi:hypothetical protein